MKTEEIRGRSDEELATLTRQLREDQYKLRVQKATNQLEDTSASRRIRRDLARVETVLRARELGKEPSKKQAAE